MMSLDLVTPYLQSSETFLHKLSGCGYALQISEIFNQENKPLLVICDTIQEAQQLIDELPFFLPEKNKDMIYFFPDWETLPYDTFSPHQDIIADRIKILALMLKNQLGIYLITAETLMQRLTPKENLASQIFLLKCGDALNLESKRAEWISLGYQYVNEVIRQGEFAIRGAIIDIFPSNSDAPYRIDLFDNEIDSIRTFSIDNQRSIEKIDHIELLPAKEFSLTTKTITHFSEQWQKLFGKNTLNCSFYQAVISGKPFGGIEYYIPLLFPDTSSIFDYLHHQFFILYPHHLHETLDKHKHNIQERYQQKSHDITQPILPPDRLWLSAEDIFIGLKKFVRYKILPSENTEKRLPMLDNETLNILNQTHLKNYRILIAAESAGRKEVIKTLLNKQGKQAQDISTWADFLSSDNHLCIAIAPIWMGVELQKHQLAIISEYELTHKKIQQRKKNQRYNTNTPQLIYHSLAELNIGDPVVHIEHGIGRYLGLQVLTIGQMTNEFVTLEYQQGNKLFIPVSNLHLISRYSAGNIEHAPLHALGSDQWEKARKKAMEKAHDAAAELLSIYAKRELSSTEPMLMDDGGYEQFCQGFPFEETPDQAEAIKAVLQDLQSKRPMDRVICGDVGFGKTEVAMRAAFLTVMNHQQVAILVPTTLLAEQHGENFNNRFSAWPVKIAVLSRFKTVKEQKSIIEELKTGKIDIVIGTHKLLQEDVSFHTIGLLIIDEEHRFGVRQKEKFKKLKAKVNILTMTATPIPRTLNMAMSKLRDFSIIATPPAKRLSIKTFLHERRTSIITEAIERELHRGGQVFFLHNNVTTIEHCAEELKRLLPQISIRFAHGQMSERDLEIIMADFYHQRFSVLVCTTIIETGIDIPTANTIIIDRADKLGLAQLHQLRGRVGRSHHQAYAYLLYPSAENLGADAQKRLDAIASLGDLGAGFQLASHDLEIRGAGELLGEEQSGQIQEVGFSLYLELIEKAIHTLKSGGKLQDILNFGREYDVDIGLPALIPESFMPDVHSRLEFYQRFSDAKSKVDLEQLHVEIIDRFGLLPQTLKNLMSAHEIKLDCQTLGIKKLSANKSFIKLEFNSSTPINPMTLITLVQSKPNLYQLPNTHSFKANIDEHSDEQRVEKIYALLKMIRN